MRERDESGRRGGGGRGGVSEQAEAAPALQGVNKPASRPGKEAAGGRLARTVASTTLSAVPGLQYTFTSVVCRNRDCCAWRGRRRIIVWASITAGVKRSSGAIASGAEVPPPSGGGGLHAPRPVPRRLLTQRDYYL